MCRNAGHAEGSYVDSAPRVSQSSLSQPEIRWNRGIATHLVNPESMSFGTLRPRRTAGLGQGSLAAPTPSCQHAKPVRFLGLGWTIKEAVDSALPISCSVCRRATPSDSIISESVSASTCNLVAEGREQHCRERIPREAVSCVHGQVLHPIPG